MQKRMILLLVVLSLAFTGCGETAAGEAITDEVQMVFFTPYFLEETWVVHLDKDGTLTTGCGQRANDDFETLASLDAATMEHAQRKLTEKQIGIFNAEIARFKQLEEVEVTKDVDGMNFQIAVFCGGKTYCFYFIESDKTFDPYVDFVDVFIAFSPKEIPTEDIWGLRQ